MGLHFCFCVFRTVCCDLYWKTIFLIIFHFPGYYQSCTLFGIKLNYMLYKAIEYLSISKVVHKRGWGFVFFRSFSVVSGFFQVVLARSSLFWLVKARSRSFSFLHKRRLHRMFDLQIQYKWTSSYILYAFFTSNGFSNSVSVSLKF